MLSLDCYQALIKSVHLPGSQFPVADAGIKSTHTCPAKARVLCAQPWCFCSPRRNRTRGGGHRESHMAGLGQSLGLSLCPGQQWSLCSRGRAGNLLVANWSRSWRKVLTFSHDFIQDVAQFKGGDLCVLQKRGKQVFHCELQTPSHEQPPTALGDIPWSSSFPWIDAQVVSSPHHPFPGAPPSPSSTALPCVLADGAAGFAWALGQARAAWGEGMAQPSSSPGGTRAPTTNALPKGQN